MSEETKTFESVTAAIEYLKTQANVRAVSVSLTRQPERVQHVIDGKATFRGERGFRVISGGLIESLTLIDCEDVEIDGQAFSPIKDYALSVQSCSKVKVTNGEFSGRADAFQAQTKGIYVRDSHTVEVSQNRFSALMRGAVFDHSTDLVVSGNSVSENRSEGFNFVGCVDVLIDNNNGTNFRPMAGDHPDFIQFWTRGARRASERIVIRNNVCRLGDGGGAQGVFMDNDDSIAYRDVTIENNLIESCYPRGISLTLADGVAIRGNTAVQAKQGQGFNLQLRAERCMNGIVENNIANSITVEGLTNQGNVVMRHPNYAKVFDGADVTKPLGQAGYRKS